MNIEDKILENLKREYPSNSFKMKRESLDHMSINDERIYRIIINNKPVDFLWSASIFEKYYNVLPYLKNHLLITILRYIKVI